MHFLNDFPDAKLYYAMVKDHVYDRNLWDDCVQEAIIEVWMVKEKHPGKPQAYYNAVARRHIQRVSKTQLFLDAPPETCGKWLPRKKDNCGRRDNHPGDCIAKSTLGKKGDTCRRTNASHDVLRRPYASLDQINGWTGPDKGNQPPEGVSARDVV